MASIGSFTVTQFRIAMPRPRRPYARLAPFSGVNNYTLVRGSPRIEPAKGPTGVILSNRAAVQSLLNAYLAAIGSVVTVIDQFDVAFSQCTILDVDPFPSDYLGAGRLDAVWTIDVPLVGS